MKRRLALFAALLGATAAPIVAQNAYADSASDDSTPTQATVWYDPNTHPVPHRLTAGATTVTPMATGGGCTSSYGGRACLSYKGSQKALLADFYVGSWDHVDRSGTGYVYIEDSNGNVYYRYTALTNFIGHYPASSLDVGNTSGAAWTDVDFYDSSGNWINTASSPIQAWP